jgi:hypothetical protein
MAEHNRDGAMNAALGYTEQQVSRGKALLAKGVGTRQACSNRLAYGAMLNDLDDTSAKTLAAFAQATGCSTGTARHYRSVARIITPDHARRVTDAPTVVSYSLLSRILLSKDISHEQADRVTALWKGIHHAATTGAPALTLDHVKQYADTPRPAAPVIDTADLTERIANEVLARIAPAISPPAPPAEPRQHAAPRRDTAPAPMMRAVRFQRAGHRLKDAHALIQEAIALLEAGEMMSENAQWILSKDLEKITGACAEASAVMSGEHVVSDELINKLMEK